MKNTILLLFIILSNYTFAQNINFPDSNAIWSANDKKYFMDGDSTIGNLTYQKFYYCQDSIISDSIFYALFRYDSLTKKAYSIHHFQQTENLMYDFSLQAGDTVVVYPLEYGQYPGDSSAMVVANIDTIYLLSQPYRRFFMVERDSYYGIDEFWIEGIGSTFGLFSPGIIQIYQSEIHWPNLLCFEKEGVMVFDNPDFVGCYYEPFGGLSNIEKTLDLKMYPNPSSGKISISSQVSIISIEILNLQGQFLERREVGTKKINIDLTEYANEILLIRINTDEGSVVRKVVRN